MGGGDGEAVEGGEQVASFTLEGLQGEIDLICLHNSSGYFDNIIDPRQL